MSSVDSTVSLEPGSNRSGPSTKLSIALAIGVFLIAGVTAFAVSRIRNAPDAVEISPPFVDFGEVKQNQMLETDFTVANHGDEDLVLDQIKTSCGCMTLLRGLEGGGTAPLEDRIVIAPRETSLFRSGITASMTKGVTMGAVSMRTNSMEFPQIQFEMKADVMGGLNSIPSSVGAGRLVEGDRKTITVQVVDGNPKHPFEFDRVESSSDSVQIETEIAQDRTQTEVGRSVCDVKITILAKEPGRLSSEVRVFGKNAARPEFVIPVSAEVIPIWSLLPSGVVFPLPGGSDRYSIEVQALKAGTTPAEFKFESLPEWLVAEYVTAADKGFRARLSVPESFRSKTLNAKLTVVRPDESDAGRPVVLPVFLRPPRE